MGTFMGHILPGTFFISFAIWWSFMTTLRYIKCRNRNANSKTIVKKYTSSVTMPCICCKSRLQRLPIESLIKLIFTVIGILGEVVTGIKIHSNPTINIESVTQMQGMTEGMHHQHGKREDHVPEVQITTWHFEGVNAQHSTMYFAFALGAIVEILISYKVHLPKRLDFICGIFSFGIEALLFTFHLHGRDEVDTQIHTLLIIAIYGCVISCILEFVNPHNVLYTYSRILFTFLQGTWFYEAGFILYPPVKSLENRWDANNHQHIMFITMSYIWHFLIIFIALLMQFLILNHFFGTKYSILEDAESIEDSQQFEYLMLDNKKLLSNNNDNKFNILNEAPTNRGLSDDDDSEIEFDNSKIIGNSANNSNSVKSNSSDRKR